MARVTDGAAGIDSNSQQCPFRFRGGRGGKKPGPGITRIGGHRRRSQGGQGAVGAGWPRTGFVGGTRRWGHGFGWSRRCRGKRVSRRGFCSSKNDGRLEMVITSGTGGRKGDQPTGQDRYQRSCEKATQRHGAIGHKPKPGTPRHRDGGPKKAPEKMATCRINSIHPTPLPRRKQPKTSIPRISGFPPLIRGRPPGHRRPG